MKWWLISCWLITCILIAVGIYRQQANKVRDYVNWVEFCNHLHQSIGFALQPLPQVVAAYLPVCRGSCQSVLRGYWQLLQNNVDLTRERCTQLTADTMLAEFLYQLGRTGRATEQEKIMAARVILDEKAKQAKHELQTKTSIVAKLLIIIGIAGGILWI